MVEAENLNINKRSFYSLVKGRLLRIPTYQRKYNWNEENWEPFIRSISSFIEKYKHEDKEGSEKWYLRSEYFAGATILEKRAEKVKNSDKKIPYFNIIDGQQRLITIFLILVLVYKKSKLVEGSTKETIKKILLSGQKTRIKLSNQKNKEEFEKIILSPWVKSELIHPPKKEQTNIFQFYEWFERYLNGEDEKFLLDICNVLVESLCFASVEIGEEENIWELFAALNTTGLNLSVADLIRGLLIDTHGDYSEEKVDLKWDNMVEMVSFPSKSQAKDEQKINREIEDFLEDFWIAKFGEDQEIKNKQKVPLKSIRNNLFELFRYKIEQTDKNSDSLLDNLLKYAEVYGNIKEPEWSFWKDTQWSVEYFYTLNCIYLLGFSRLFPIILKMHFALKKRETETKDQKILVKKREGMGLELEILMLFMFRTITIKKRTYDEIRKYIPEILGEIEQGRLFSKENKDKLLKEFEEKETKEFFEELEDYRQKNSSIWSFIFENYYAEIFAKNRGMGIEIGFDIKKAILESEELSVEHLIPRKKPSEITDEQWNDFKKDETQYQLGNITLLRQKKNSQLSNLVWKKKCKKLKEMGSKCSLTWEKNPFFLNLEELSINQIKERTKNLISEFDALSLFIPKYFWEKLKQNPQLFYDPRLTSDHPGKFKEECWLFDSFEKGEFINFYIPYSLLKTSLQRRKFYLIKGADKIKTETFEISKNSKKVLYKIAVAGTKIEVNPA